MALASNRTQRVALYTYTAPVDANGVAVSTYTRTLSADTDGLWWAARGTPRARETAPATTSQHVVDAVFEFHAAVPVTDNGVIKHGDEVFRIVGVMPRKMWRNEVQALGVRVDDADAAFNLVEP